MDDLSCPVCLDLLKDPFVTPCGHTFCHSCVTSHLQNKKTCPGCSQYLTADQVYPNHLLCKLAASHAKRKQMETSTLLEKVQNTIASDGQPLQLSDVEALLEDLQEKRQDMQQKEGTRSLEVLLHFLEHSRENKAERLSDLQDELSVLHKDIDQLHERKSAQLLHHTNQPRLALPHTVPVPAHLPGTGQAAQGGRLLLGAGEGSMQSHGVAFRQAGSEAERPLFVGTNLSQAVAVPPRDQLGNAERHGIPALPTNLLRVHRETLNPHSRSQAQGNLGRRDLQMERYPTSLPAAETMEGQAQARAAAFLRVPSFDQGSLPPVSQPPGGPIAAGGGGSTAHLAADVLPNPPTMAEGHMGTDIAEGGGSVGVARSVTDATGNDASLSGIEGFANGHTPHLNGHLSAHDPDTTATESASVRQEGGASSATHGSTDPRNAAELGSSVSQKRDMEHFDDLQAQYFKMRQKQLQSMKRRRLGDLNNETLESDRTPFANGLDVRLNSDWGRDSHGPSEQEGSSWMGKSGGDRDSALPSVGRPDMQEFSRSLSLYSQHTRLEVMATISASTPRNAAAILSSMAFSPSCRLFATAGVSKRVALYDKESVLEEATASSEREASNSPLAELMTPSKLSCISWNPCEESHLLSSDYEGVITLWDVKSQQAVTELEAHQRRIWSVEYCPTSSHILVSASDDGLVKLWSTRQNKSHGEINMNANVCCAQFNPGNEQEIAIGCADHCVHLFDLRHFRRPLHSFAGHSKSVSYVRYMSASKVVSASTDSTLRLWGSRSQGLLRTYTGHTNRKNFVGLAVDGDFIASGSETKEVYIYYKSMSRPVAKTMLKPRFQPQSQPWHSGPAFISALCWQPHSEARVLLAGTSQGTIKLLKLVSSV